MITKAKRATNSKAKIGTRANGSKKTAASSKRSKVKVNGVKAYKGFKRDFNKIHNTNINDINKKYPNHTQAQRNKLLAARKEAIKKGDPNRHWLDKSGTIMSTMIGY